MRYVSGIVVSRREKPSNDPNRVSLVFTVKRRIDEGRGRNRLFFSFSFSPLPSFSSSRIIPTIVGEIEARAYVQPSLCVRAKVLGDAVHELLALQLHLEGLSRVRNDEGIRRRRLPKIPCRYFRPFGVERIGRTSSTRLTAHRGRAERESPRV